LVTKEKKTEEKKAKGKDKISEDYKIEEGQAKGRPNYWKKK
jgi:hypothetical protein